jgi:hypothetical protein
MMGVQATSARLFYDFCLDDHVPSDHILRSIDRHLDLKEKLIKIGAKVIGHGRYFAFQMAGVAIPRSVFADILRLIAELQSPPVASTAKSVRLSRVPSKTTGDLRHNDRKNYTFDARRTSAKVLGDETPARPRTELPKAIESGSLSVGEAAIRRMQDRGTMPRLSRRGERRRNGLLRTLLRLSCQTLIRQEDNAMNSVNYLIPAAIATFSLAGAVGASTRMVICSGASPPAAS